MNNKQLIEEQGRAPVLGWIDNRAFGCPVNLRVTDVKETWRKAKLREIQKGNITRSNAHDERVEAMTRKRLEMMAAQAA